MNEEKKPETRPHKRALGVVLALAVLVLLSVMLAGCAALKQALGLETAQTAPTHVTAGIAVFNMVPPKAGAADGASGVTISFEDIANGDLGSESDGKGGDGSATQTTKVDPEAVGKAVKDVVAPTFELADPPE